MNFSYVFIFVAVDIAGISVSTAAQMLDIGWFDVDVGGHQQFGLNRGVLEIVLVGFLVATVEAASSEWNLVVVIFEMVVMRFFHVMQL